MPEYFINKMSSADSYGGRNLVQKKSNLNLGKAVLFRIFAKLLLDLTW